MKILLDSAIIPKLEEVYGPKTPQVIFNAISYYSLDQGVMELTYEEVIRRQKIGQRLAVSQNENSRDILSYLNRVTGKNFRPVDANLKLISSLLKDYSRPEIERVIDNKTSKWKGTDFDDYLRPSTLFRKSNFDGYLNEAPSPKLVEKNFADSLDALIGE